MFLTLFSSLWIFPAIRKARHSCKYLWFVAGGLTSGQSSMSSHLQRPNFGDVSPCPSPEEESYERSVVRWLRYTIAPNPSKERGQIMFAFFLLASRVTTRNGNRRAERVIDHTSEEHTRRSPESW